MEDNRSSLLGNWIGTQITYRFRASLLGDITVGCRDQDRSWNRQEDYDVAPVPVDYLNTSNPDRTFALIVQEEKKLSSRWKLDLGVRGDKSTYRRDSVSPRAALLYQRWTGPTNFSTAAAFATPAHSSCFTTTDFPARPIPPRVPSGRTRVEIDMERKLGNRMSVQASAYGYRLHDFLLGVYLSDGLLQYQNADTIRAEGVELEINGRPSNWLEATASYAFQRSRDNTGALENSPGNLAKLHFAVPLGQKFDLSSGMQYASTRVTLAQNSLKPVYLADFTLTSKHLLPDFDVRLGLRNAFNLHYSDPVALFPTVDSMPQPGRSFFVELIAHARR